MTCLDLLEAISAYIDGEATREERLAVERHVASCAECAARLGSFRALKHAVARLEGRTVPPEALKARVEALRFGPVRLGARFGRMMAAAGLVAATLVVLLAVWRHEGARPPLPRQLIADHLRSGPDLVPAEVASADPDEVLRFFEAKVPFDPVVPPLGAAKLIGGRLCKIEGRKVELLFYELGDRRFSLYVSDRPAGMRACHRSGEYAVCAKRRGRLLLMLVGRATEHELRALLNEATL